jgi:hypothetical protein
MPKLMVMPDPLQQQKPPNLNHQRTRLFGTRDEQAAFPQPQSTTEQQREDGKGESGFTKVIPIRREVSAGGYPNKLSLFRGVQSTIGNGNGKENEGCLLVLFRFYLLKFRQEKM